MPVVPCFLDMRESERERENPLSMYYIIQCCFGGHEYLVRNLDFRHTFRHAYLQESSTKHFPTIPCNIIHPCHVGGLQLDYSIHWKMLWVLVQSCPHVNPKGGLVTLSTNENSRILKSHGLMAFLYKHGLIWLQVSDICMFVWVYTRVQGQKYSKSERSHCSRAKFSTKGFKLGSMPKVSINKVAL